MNMKKITALFIILVAVSSCYSDSKEVVYRNYEPCVLDLTEPIAYSTDVSAIMTQSCAISKCHNSQSRKAGLDLSNYNDVKAIADDGRMIKRINGEGSIMPPSGPLRSCDIQTLEIWVQEGALNN